MMKPLILLTLAAVALSGCNAIIPTQPDQPRMLSAQEVEALFKEHTVRSYNLNTKVSTWSYYRADGQLFQERFWEKRQGRWTVEPDGAICLNVNSRSCRYIGKVGERIYKFRPDDDGKLERIIRYKDFMPGNPFEL